MVWLRLASWVMWLTSNVSSKYEVMKLVESIELQGTYPPLWKLQCESASRQSLHSDICLRKHIIEGVEWHRE